MENSSKFESKEHTPLIQQFKKLEKQWKSLQNSKPRSCLISSDSSDITTFDQLLGNSPRELMSSLQKSPEDRVYRMRTRNMAVEEILRDRRAAIMTGKLKGRRLFGAAAEEESDLNYGSSGGGVCSDLSCSFSGCSSSEEKVMVAEEKRVVEVGDGAAKRGGFGGRVVPMAWFAVVLILITLGLVSLSCNGKYLHRNAEIFLVPT